MTAPCSGPCLPHCSRRTIVSIIGAIVVACAWYAWTTQSLGTPFADSLSAEQRALKRTAMRVRGARFLEGLVLGTTLVWLVG